METTSLIDLAKRLQEISKIQKQLTAEYNAIIEELWRRFPPMYDDPNIQKIEIKEGQDNAKVRR